MSGRHSWSTIRDQYTDSPERETRVEQYQQAMRTISRLEQLREARGMTQAQLADAIGINQQTVSKREHSDNPYLDSIREYVEGLGGELHLVAVFPEESIEVAVSPR